MRTSPLKFKALLSILIAAIGIFAVMVYVGKVLTPFIIALTLAYIFNPLVIRLENSFKIKRKYSAVMFSLLTLLVFISIPSILVPMLVNELISIVDKTPEIMNMVNSHVLSPINHHIGTHLNG
jgi:predicted PurR-regulated permease PerM